MIHPKKNPIDWADMMYELEDAREHLGVLLSEIESDSEFSEEDFRVQLGHIYAHLNRAWFCRNLPEGMSKSDWENGKDFPVDIHPII